MKSLVTIACALFAAALLPGAFAQDKDAEKIFRDMEKKVKDAKAIEVTFRYQLVGKNAKGALLMTNDGKARIAVMGNYFFGIKGNSSFTLLSDGKNYKVTGAKFGIATIGRPFIEPGGSSEGQLGKGFREMTTATLTRGGIGLTVIGLPYLVSIDAGIDPDEQESKMTVYDFKMGAADKIGDRKAKVLHYRHGKGGNDDPDMTLWLDDETGLPLKRVFQQPRGEKIRIEDTYNSLKLNPEFKASIFELPK